MENLSPPRIQPLSPGEQKSQDPTITKKPAKTATPVKAVPPPPVGGETDEKHELDERA